MCDFDMIAEPTVLNTARAACISGRSVRWSKDGLPASIAEIGYLVHRNVDILALSRRLAPSAILLVALHVSLLVREIT